jgi:magnesium chelatase subunit I
MTKPSIATLGDLIKSGYTYKSIKEEVYQNLMHNIGENKPSFPGIYGYDDTVIPDIEKALLSQHNILLLGLRGQAKTRMARQIIDLLDEWIPLIEGTEIPDDPLMPITISGKALIAELGKKTPIIWQHKSERFNEKLATPDVSVADLIGDIDPIKAAHQKMNLSDERIINYGLIPKSNKGIFVINELPDLQARIQVALFNILQEQDIQIRGFKIRLPLDVLFIFTANPEDYTNRGSIVTPLKDRIESQILTHYPNDILLSKKITLQESKLSTWQKENIEVDILVQDLIETIAIEARTSEFVDQKSGVSARLTIAAYELLHAAVQRRAMKNKESKSFARISDVYGILPAITGKVELVYEGEQEGAGQVAIHLLGKAVRSLFGKFFPSPELLRKSKKKEEDPYKAIVSWFNNNSLKIDSSLTDEAYKKLLLSVPTLKEFVEQNIIAQTKDGQFLWMEFVLHGLAEFSVISKRINTHGAEFTDMLSGMMNTNFGSDEDDED